MEKILTLTKARESFFLACQVEGFSKKTLDLYEHVLTKLEIFLNGKDLTEITPTDIRRYLFDLKGKGYSQSTVYTHYKNLSAFLNFLTSEELIEKNPASGIKAPKIPKVFPYVLSEEEVYRLLLASKEKDFAAKRNYAMISLMVDTGIRVSELCALRVEDVNFASMSIKVQGKGGKERTILFSKQCAKALTSYLKVRSHVPFEDTLFVTKEGEPFKPRGIQQILKRIAVKAGLKDKRVSPHTLRHTFATLYVKRGGSPFVLQRLLGHSDLKTVMVYVNLVGKDLREDYFTHSPLDNLR